MFIIPKCMIVQGEYLEKKYEAKHSNIASTIFLDALQRYQLRKSLLNIVLECKRSNLRSSVNHQSIIA
jgi:hypothetical protein